MVKTIQYRTCFRVKSKRTEEHSSEKLFRKIQLEFWKWLKKKEISCPQPFSEEMQKNFFWKMDVSGLGESKSSIDTGSVISDEGKAWCFRYSHYDSETKNRRWIVEAGLRYLKKSDDVVVAVTSMYEDLESNVIFEVVKTPLPSVPGCVLQIFSISDARFTFGGNNQDFGVGNIPLKIGWTKLIVDFLKSDSRRFPVVVFNGNKNYADEFSKKIAGKAICVTIPEEAPDVFQSLVEGLGYDRDGKLFSIPKDGLRVFFPFTKFGKSWEAPIIKITPEELNSVGKKLSERSKRLVRLVLTNVIPCSDWAVAVEKMSDIVRLREEANRTQREKERSAQKEEERKRLDELLKTKKKNVAEYKELAELYESDARDWKEKYEEERQKNDVLTQNAQCSYGYTQPETIIRVMESLPSSFEECIKIGKSQFSNLEFSENARKSAAEATDGKTPKNVCMLWEMLWHLDSTLWDLKFRSRKTVDYVSEFKSKSGYTYAKGEGRMTNADPRLMRERTISHNGRVFETIIHLKPKGNKDWRVYFDYDEENRKIVIGHIGNHLDNATTRKRS